MDSWIKATHNESECNFKIRTPCSVFFLGEFSPKRGTGEWLAKLTKGNLGKKPTQVARNLPPKPECSPCSRQDIWDVCQNSLNRTATKSSKDETLKWSFASSATWPHRPFATAPYFEILGFAISPHQNFTTFANCFLSILARNPWLCIR